MRIRLGYEQACKAYDIEPVVARPDGTQRDGYDVCARRARLPQGIQAANDRNHRRDALHLRNVGEWFRATMRVVGFTTTSTHDSYASLTTIHQAATAGALRYLVRRSWTVAHRDSCSRRASHPEPISWCFSHGP